MAERLAKRVLLIGWDAADWKVMSPLLDAGKMPALASLIERGVMGNLATLEPPFSPMLWTSIATVCPLSAAALTAVSAWRRRPGLKSWSQTSGATSLSVRSPAFW